MTQDVQVGTATDLIPASSDGWQHLSTQVFSPVPLDHAVAEAVDLRDYQLFGIDLSGLDLASLQAQYQQNGSDLYAVVLYKNPHTFLGTGYDDYRMIVVHSQATILIQWVTLAVVAVFAFELLTHFDQLGNGLQQFANDLSIPVTNTIAATGNTAIFFTAAMILLGFGVYFADKGLTGGHSGIRFQPQQPHVMFTGGGSSGFDIKAGPLSAGSRSERGSVFGGAGNVFRQPERRARG